MKPTWKTGLARSMCPKWPGHSVWLPAKRHIECLVDNSHCTLKYFTLPVQQWYSHQISYSCFDETINKGMDHISSNCKTVKFLPAQVWQREFLSMTPWRGSIRPWSFGLPPSYVSGKRMPPSVTDIRRYKRRTKSQLYWSISKYFTVTTT